MLPVRIEQSLARVDCNCCDGLWPNMIYSWLLGAWLPEQNCGSVSYEEGDGLWLLGRQPTAFAQRINTHRHLERPLTRALLCWLLQTLLGSAGHTLPSGCSQSECPGCMATWSKEGQGGLLSSVQCVIWIPRQHSCDQSCTCAPRNSSCSSCL